MILQPNARTFVSGRLLLTRYFPTVALILLMCLVASPSLAQERLPAPPAVRTMYSVVYGREGHEECHKESGECIGYVASKCIGLTFKILSGTQASDYSLRIWSGKKKPAKVEAGFVPYSTRWFNITEWRVDQAPHISGGIFVMETWPSLDYGTYATYDICGFANDQTVNMMFRAIDSREDSPYKYGAKTQVITVEL